MKAQVKKPLPANSESVRTGHEYIDSRFNPNIIKPPQLLFLSPTKRPATNSIQVH